MSNKHSVKKNMVMNSILTMSSLIFPLITFPYVSRVLLPEGTGKVSFATSVITYFSIFAQLGIPTYGVRACARVRDDKERLSRTVKEIMTINLITCLFAYIALFIALLLVPRLQTEKILMIIVSSTIFFNAIGVEWLYRALEEYQYITVRSIIFKIVALVALFLLVHHKEDYVIYGAISIFAGSASNICNFVHMRKFVSFSHTGRCNYIEHLKPILTFFLMSVATVIYGHLDTVMLGFMNTDSVVGYYNAAIRIKGILVSVVTSASAVLLPRASYYVDKGQMEEFYAVLKKTLRFILLVAPAMALYFIFYSKEGILFLSGKEYLPSVVPMQIIMPTLVFIGITNVLGIQMMIPLGMEKMVLHSEIIGAVIDLVLNAMLIPQYGAAGAAVGTVVAEAAVLIWQYCAIHKIDKENSLFQQMPYLKIIGALAAASAASLWVKQLEIIPFFSLVISAICFFLVYIVVLVCTKEAMTISLIAQMAKKIHLRIK